MTRALDKASMVSAAEQISRQIVTSAIWHGERCNWVGAVPEDGIGGRTTLSFRALGPDLYGGTAGVGLFLAEIAAVTEDADSRRTALGALKHAISRADSLPAESQLGLYAGLPGIALALALAARRLDEPELEVAARTIASATAGQRAGDVEHDLMSGTAGAVLGLLSLHALLDDSALLDLAIRHGEALISGAERANGSLSWRSPGLPDAPGLTGFSHGAAGVAVALLELDEATGARRYRDAAAGAFAYERSLYDPVARNWPDLRDATRGQVPTDAGFASFWCHGAPGGALARLRALELGGNAELREEARAALQTTEEWVAAALSAGSVNYSLCHGLSGNAEVMWEGRDLLRPDASALITSVASAGIDTYQAAGLPWPSGAHGGPTPSLFLGLAGIGRFYLRLARPELPSLLLVRPKATAR